MVVLINFPPNLIFCFIDLLLFSFGRLCPLRITEIPVKRSIRLPFEGIIADLFECHDVS